MSEYNSIQRYRIGQNIQSIRNHNGLSTDQFGRLIGLDGQTIKKIESGNYLHSLNPHIEQIVKLSGIPNVSFNSIVNGDLSYLVKGDLNLGKLTVGEFYDETDIEKDMDDVFEKEIHLSFPFLKDEKSLKCPSFEKAQQIITSKEQPWHVNYETIDKLIALYKQSLEEGATRVAKVNILTCIGYAFSYIPFEEKYGVFKDINKDKTFGSAMEFIEITAEALNFQKLFKIQQEVLLKYITDLELYHKEITQDKDFSDFAYFFLFTRYNRWMFLENKPRITDLQYKEIVENLLNNLVKMGNKYAIKYNDFLKENQKVL